MTRSARQPAYLLIALVMSAPLAASAEPGASAAQALVNSTKSNVKERTAPAPAAAAPAVEGQGVINTTKSNVKEHSRALMDESAGMQATDARQRQILATAARVQERISRSPGEKAALLGAKTPEAARAVLLRNGFTADQLAGASIVGQAAATSGEAQRFHIIIRFRPKFEIIWRDD